MTSWKDTLIDLLLEKYLNTYEYSIVPGLPIQYDVFENPSSKEIRECMTNGGARFIADNKTKTVYMWDGEQALHRETWFFISKKDKHDTRSLYKTEDLLVGVMTKSDVKFESNFIYALGTWQRIYATDWSWANRYVKNLTKFLEKEPTNG